MKDILREMKERVLLFDGGMGSLLQERGLAPGELPETWNLLYPEAVREIHEAYLRAGCDIVNANTFGANALHFPDGGPFGLEEIVRAGIGLAREAAKRAGHGFVALDIGPSGRLLAPMGDLDFEECVALFARTVRAGAEAGADLVMIETMSDLYEMKAAVLAAKENCELPVFATAAFDEGGRMLTGGTPEALTALLEGLRADALGLNCGLGPRQMKPVAEALLACASVPVIVTPNAGIPRTEGGRTIYDIGPEQFAEEMAEILDLGISAAGGCCGTTPDHIAALAELVRERPAPGITPKRRTVVSSFAQAVEISGDPVIIGERINPTGKKRMQQAVREGDVDYLLAVGIREEEQGARILDVNVGVPGIDEPEVLSRVVRELQGVTALPLQIDTAEPEAMERALRIYNGKALINSVNGKREVLDRILPLAAKYGGVLVGLTLDEAGIPATAEGRVEIARRICEEAGKYGIGRHEILIDCLCMTVSSDQEAALTALETVRRVKAELGVRTVMGVSNVSYGLPARDAVNAAFYTMALQAGLDAAIMNPGSAAMTAARAAFRVLAGFDKGCAQYIEAYAAFEAEEKAKRLAAERRAGEAAGSEAGKFAGPGADQAAERAAERNAAAAWAAVPDGAADAGAQLQEAVLRGRKKQAADLTRGLLECTAPLEIVNAHLVPALDLAGQSFEAGTLFLPQLLACAETVKAAFEVIRGAMDEQSEGQVKSGRILLATVRGDIHDIGKNIVKVLLDNYGYEVTDLGKDVPAETIVEETIRSGAPLVGLSALMTTTVGAMEETIRMLKEAAPEVKIMVGGAVLTQDYADRIGADAYCRDALAAVRYAGKVLRGEPSGAGAAEE